MTLRMWRMQFLGILLLMFLAWAFLNTPDRYAWQVGLSLLLAILGLVAAAWLVAANFSGAARASRVPLVLGCVLLLLLLLWIVGMADPKLWQVSNWLASALTMKRKKPVTPEAIHNAIDWLLFLVRWIAIPLLLIPITVRAAGARPGRFWKLALAWIVLFLIGAVLPHTIIHWVPGLTGFWPQILSASARFIAAYTVMVTAWVILGRSLQQEARL